MAEEWKLESLERKIDSLQEQFKDAERRRKDRIERWLLHLIWTAYVIAMTSYIVLTATGHLHHH